MVKIFGAETGDLREALSTTGGTVTTSWTNGGGYAYSCVSNGNSIEFDTGTTLSTLYLRCVVNMTPAVSTGNIGFLNATDASLIPIGYVRAKFSATLGTWSLCASTIGGTDSAFCADIPSGVPASVLVKVTQGTGSNCTCTLTVNGQTLVSSNGTSTAIIAKVQFTGVNANFPVLMDDLYLSDVGYPDINGKCIARQFKSGTPTYNAWTKTGAASIDLCWSSTPFSATAFAVASAASQAQTALVASFSATQTGHGTATIGPADTVKAVKVSVVGKKGSGSTTTHVIRFRYNGVDNNSADWTALATTDSYFEYYPAITVTPALLNASEAGGVQGSGSGQVFTIEDVWVMVDYTPAIPGPVGNAIQLNQAVKRSAFY